MKKHLIIICGYLDTENKEGILLRLLKRLNKFFVNPNPKVSNILKEKTGKIELCYCTHHQNIPDEVYDYCDYVVYNKNNPILNWDIWDNFTRTFGSEAQFDGGKAYIQFYQPYHGYAHHLSVTDGIATGIINGFESFSLMNYDVIDFCLNEFEEHYQEISRGYYDAVFYPYEELGGKLDLIKNSINYNTEFFSFNKKVAELMMSFRNYEKFSNHQAMLYEHIVSKVIRENDCNVKVKEFPKTDNFSLGQVAFSDLTAGQDEVKLNKKYFVPFYEKWIDSKRYCFYYFTVKMGEKYCLTIIDETEGKMKCKCLINDMELNHKNGQFYNFDLPINLKITDNDEIKVNIELCDDRQFGKYFQKVQSETHGNTTVVL